MGFIVPAAVVDSLGGGKRPPVKVAINGYGYRSTIAVMGGEFMIGVSAEHRAKADVAGGEIVEVEIQRDIEPRIVEIPADLVLALAESGAKSAFDALALTYRKEHVRSVNESKTAQTRLRRIEAVVRKVLSKP